MNPILQTVDAIRDVTSRVQKELDSGRRSCHIDAHDLLEVLLAIADRLEAVAESDPPPAGT